MSTKTIDATDLRNNLSGALESVTEGQTLLVKKRGKMHSVIIDIDRFEDLLAANDPEYLKTIQEARASKERFSADDVFGSVWNEVK